MPILDSIIRLKEGERAAELADISSISQGINNYINASVQREKLDREAELQKVQIANMESLIKEREKVDPLEELLNKGKALDAAVTLADTTGNTGPLDQLRAEFGMKGAPRAVNASAVASSGVKAADLVPSPATSEPGVNDFLKPSLEPIPAFETTPSGSKLTPKGEVQKDLFQKGQEAKISVAKETKSKEEKDILTAQQDLTNIGLKSQALFDQFINVVSKNKELIGVGPGALSGAISELFTGKFKINEFVPAFKGGQIEFASAAGRVAIPGARAVRLVTLFKQTAPELFDTTESAADQVSFSFRNALNSFLSRNLQQIRPDYAESLRAGDVQRSTEILQEYNQQLDAWQQSFKDSLLKSVLFEEPDLLKEETQARIISTLTEDEVIKLQSTLEEK